MPIAFVHPIDPRRLRLMACCVIRLPLDSTNQVHYTAMFYAHDDAMRLSEVRRRS